MVKLLLLIVKEIYFFWVIQEVGLEQKIHFMEIKFMTQIYSSLNTIFILKDNGLKQFQQIHQKVVTLKML